MADAYSYVRQGEKVLIYSPEFVPDSGTLTFVSGTVTLYDSASAVAGSVSGTAVTDFTSGASAGPQGWFLMDLTGGIGSLTLANGYYTLTFAMVDNAAVPKTRKATVDLHVKAANAP